MSKEKTAFIPKQYFAVVAVLLAIMMSVLDGTIMNIALPTLAHDFDVTPSNAIWIVNAYQLVITMTLLSFASLGDIYGYRRIFLTGISIFAGASLACALSDSFWMLTVSRIIQGFGAACVMSVNTALIRLIYPPQILGRGMGVNAMVVAVSAAAGPSIAGSILALGSWHWLFVINIPLGLAALVIGHRFLPHNPASDTKHKFDKISAIANALTFGLLIYTLEGFAHAENRKFIAVQLVLLIIIGTYFIRRQLKETTPILPVDLLKIPIFALSIGTSITSFTAQMLAMVSLPFFMQNILGYSAVQIGLLLTPWPLATILTAPLAGRLVEKVHPGLLGGIGMAIFATGLFTLYLLPPHPAEWNIIWRMALCGMGFGLFQTPNNVTIVSSAPTHRSGGASGMLCTRRKQKVHCHPVGFVNHNRHLFHPPPTEGNDPYPTCGLTEDSYFRSFYRYFHHLIHRPDAGYGFLTVFYAEYIGIQRRTDRFATYPLAIGYHPDRTTCRQTGRESTSRIAGRHRHGHLRYRPIHTLFASPPSGRMEYHLANGTLWYGLRAVPDAQ